MQLLSSRGGSRVFVEWFPEQLQLSGQILGFVKGETYSSSKSLKQGLGGIWRCRITKTIT